MVITIIYGNSWMIVYVVRPYANWVWKHDASYNGGVLGWAWASPTLHCAACVCVLACTFWMVWSYFVLCHFCTCRYDILMSCSYEKNHQPLPAFCTASEEKPNFQTWVYCTIWLMLPCVCLDHTPGGDITVILGICMRRVCLAQKNIRKYAS